MQNKIDFGIQIHTMAADLMFPDGYRILQAYMLDKRIADRPRQRQVSSATQSSTQVKNLSEFLLVIFHVIFN